jgi:glycine hydroxymethyltransferase
MTNYLKDYLKDRSLPDVPAEAVAFYAALDSVAAVSPLVAEAVLKELDDQRANLKLIASENYSALAVQQAMGNLLTDKYAEGIPAARFYAGCDNVDAIESEAARLARELFGADHAYVQPHSGADANMVAFTAILAARVQRDFVEKVAKLAEEKGNEPPRDVRGLTAEDWTKLREATLHQKLMAMDIGSGGHLTHGYRMNISSWLFETHQYAVSRETGVLDYDQLAAMAREVKPLILLAGYSAYPRKIDFSKMRAIADEVGAVLMVDMAHFAGLVAGKVFTGVYDPIAFADIVTSTTHKTLRGPRGGIVLCKNWLKEFVDKGCPAMLGGPLPQMMAAKAVAFKLALEPAFRDYARRIVENSQALAAECQALGMEVLTGGTDNHLLQINVFKSFGLTGRQAEDALRSCGLTMNRNSIPFDPNGVWYTSGLRLGTPAVTTLGMGADEMKQIAAMIKKALASCKPALTKDGQPSQAKYTMDETVRAQIKEEAGQMLARFRLYPELD